MIFSAHLASAAEASFSGSWRGCTCSVRPAVLAMGTALLAGLIVFTLFGVGLQCLCLRRLYKPLASWRRARSRLVALLNQEDIQSDA